MAKLVFFAVVALALVALSTAEVDNAVQPQHCQRQLQAISLNACRQVVDHQLAVQLPFFQPQSSVQRSEQWRTYVRGQCCQQLQHISPECRAAAIRRIVRHYEQQAVAPLREGSYYPGQDEEHQAVAPLGWPYYPRESYPKQEQGREQPQEGQGWYLPSPAFPQPLKQGGGSCGESRQPAPQPSFGETARQPEGQGPYFGRPGQHMGFGGYSPSHRFGTGHEQQETRLKQLRVVARARQVAAQLPAMCGLGRAFSAGQY